ncbi:MAG: hypothetical protein OXI76_14220 [Gemmatimonadota bacterium]|nr:hypothetical protein [Gemmatimonadota bacterium]
METARTRDGHGRACVRFAGRLFVLLAGTVLVVGCGGEGSEPGAEDAGTGVDSESASESAAATDLDDPAAATPVLGAAGNPAEGAVGLPGAGANTVGAVPQPGALTTDALEELPIRRVPAGTRIRVTADYEISTDLYRPGDPVVATVAEDVTDPAGEVLIPRGVKLLGRILTSAGSPGVGEPPVLEMAFETLSALNAEWPVEGAVINVPVVVDSRADIARRFQRNRSRDREVPGRILEGAVVVVELRAGVRVGPIVGPEVFPWDSLPGWDTLPRVDTLPG